MDSVIHHSIAMAIFRLKPKRVEKYDQAKQII